MRRPPGLAAESPVFSPSCPAFFPQGMLAGAVPWPGAAREAPLNPSPAALALLGAAPVPCVRLAYALFYLSPATGAALLHLARKAANLVLVADFKLAERNLELPAVLAAQGLARLSALLQAFWRGRARGAAEGDILACGGLEGLARLAEAPVLKRRPLLGGAAVLLTVRGGLRDGALPGLPAPAARARADFPALHPGRE